jgi:glycerol kinase
MAVGYWNGLHEIEEYWKANTVFKPAMNDQTRDHLTKGWLRAVKTTQAWTEV